MEGFDATKLDKINLGHSEDMKAYIPSYKLQGNF